MQVCGGTVIVDSSTIANIVQYTRELNSSNSGGPWNTNDSLSATVVRRAGLGAIGGGVFGGPLGALAGGVVGALSGFSSHAGNK